MNLMTEQHRCDEELWTATRELDIKSQRAEKEQVLVSVSDTGLGVPRQTGGPDVRCVLHHQTSRHRHGTADQPLYR